MSVANYLSYIVGIYREEEGLTLVFSDEIKEEMESISQDVHFASERKMHQTSGVSTPDAEKVLGPFALITLKVNSGLFAVGLLASVTGALAKEGIPVNAFSAYHHDHLLVPYEKKDAALAALKKLQKSA